MTRRKPIRNLLAISAIALGVSQLDNFRPELHKAYQETSAVIRGEKTSFKKEDFSSREILAGTLYTSSLLGAIYLITRK